jgi:hypothetical protein
VIRQAGIREQLPPSLKSLAVACPKPEEQEVIETKNKSKNKERRRTGEQEQKSRKEGSYPAVTRKKIERNNNKLILKTTKPLMVSSELAPPLSTK